MNQELREKICNAHYLSYNKDGNSYVPCGNINELLTVRQQSSGRDLFLRYFSEGKYTDYSYETFIKKVWFLSGYLLEKGIRKEDRIAVYSHNHSDTAILYFAAWNIGAAVVPLNVSESLERIEFILKNSASVCCLQGRKMLKLLTRLAGDSILRR